jgi:hypothetical protein
MKELTAAATLVTIVPPSVQARSPNSQTRCQRRVYLGVDSRRSEPEGDACWQVDEKRPKR